MMLAIIFLLTFAPLEVSSHFSLLPQAAKQENEMALLSWGSSLAQS